MSFLDKLKFWKSKAPEPIGPDAPPAAAPILIEADPLLAALAEREEFNRSAARATESAHQRDKHMDRADEDAWIASEIRRAVK